MEPKVEPRPPLEQIKLRNEEAIIRVVQKLLKHLIFEKSGNLLSISADEQNDTIHDEYSSFQVTGSISGSIDLDNLDHLQELKVRLWCSGNYSDLVAFRSYSYKIFNNRQDVLHAKSGLYVEPRFRKIGACSALLLFDDSVNSIIAEHLKKSKPISMIEAYITDGTVGDGKGWTTRRFKERMGWEEIHKGLFRKITRL